MRSQHFQNLKPFVSQEPEQSDLAKVGLSIPLAANICTKSDTSYVVLQAHSDALGSWGDNGAAARRAWEGDGRIDLRSVTNCLRQLPYHVAWQKGFRQAAGVLNPTVPIDSALETCRELGEGQHTLSGLVDMLLDCLCNARSFVCDAKQGVPRHNSCLASFLLVSYLQCKVRRDVKVV